MAQNLQKGLAIIILNWNAAADTVRCAKRVAGWHDLRPAVWIVDNGSDDDSTQLISRECPGVQLILNGANLGYAGGNNRGIVQALAHQNCPLLLLNNDAHIEEADMARLITTLTEDERIGIIGPLIFDADDSDRLLVAGGKDPVLHHRSHILELTPGRTVRTVDYVPGTVLLARPEIFGTVGLLDEAFFFNTEVADLCKRARQQGFVCAVDTRAHAFHALDRRPSRLRETLYTYYVIRNRFLYIRKFFRWLKIPLTVIWGLYSLALALKLRMAAGPAAAQSVLLGLTDGLLGRFGGQNERVLKKLAE
jgi:GT2 family glycosyltransferase